MGTHTAERVATEVRGHLARQRKTQGQLATAIGMSQQALSRRILGQLPFDLDELSRIAEFLDLPVSAFVVPDPTEATA